MEYGIFPQWQFFREQYGMEKALALFGPYAGANITCRYIDRNTLESRMELTPMNTNYVGTHFGGSLYSMCDPFFMFILMENLGHDYMVWDKSATIDFIKPGRGTVVARFHIPEAKIAEIREIVARQRKTEETFVCDVVHEQGGDVVARVKKLLYIRRMPPRRKGD